MAGAIFEGAMSQVFTERSKRIMSWGSGSVSSKSIAGRSWERGTQENNGEVVEGKHRPAIAPHATCELLALV